MSGPGKITPSDAFRTALELHDTGVRLMRENLRRANPAASEEEIAERLRRWLAGNALVTRRESMLRVIANADDRLRFLRWT